MAIIKYDSNNQRIDKVLLFYEMDKSIVVQTKARKATLSSGGQRVTIDVVNGVFEISQEFIKKQEIKVTLDGKKADSIIIESVQDIEHKYLQAFPEVATLPARVSQLEESNKALVSLINNKYSKTIIELDKRLKKLESKYDILKV